MGAGFYHSLSIVLFLTAHTLSEIEADEDPLVNCSKDADCNPFFKDDFPRSLVICHQRKMVKTIDKICTFKTIHSKKYKDEGAVATEPARPNKKKCRKVASGNECSTLCYQTENTVYDHKGMLKLCLRNLTPYECTEGGKRYCGCGMLGTDEPVKKGDVQGSKC